MLDHKRLSPALVSTALAALATWAPPLAPRILVDAEAGVRLCMVAAEYVPLHDALFGLNTALSGLVAQQRALDTTNHNLANVNTEGYSRQRVSTQASLAYAQPALNTAPPFSIEFWAKPNSLGTNDPGLCPLSSFDPNWYGGANRSGWLFYVNSNGVWYFRLGNTSGTAVNLIATNGTASVGVWQHIVATCSSTNANLYANGVLIGSALIPAGSYVPNSQSFLRIGGTPLSGQGAFATAISASSNLGNRGYDGWVDEVALYTNLLSPATVAAHYAAATTNNAGYQTQILANAPVGYWNLNEPAVTAPSGSSLPGVTNSGSLGSAKRYCRA